MLLQPHHTQCSKRAYNRFRHRPSTMNWQCASAWHIFTKRTRMHTRTATECAHLTPTNYAVQGITFSVCASRSAGASACQHASAPNRRHSFLDKWISTSGHAHCSAYKSATGDGFAMNMSDGARICELNVRQRNSDRKKSVWWRAGRQSGRWMCIVNDVWSIISAFFVNRSAYYVLNTCVILIQAYWRPMAC